MIITSNIRKAMTEKSSMQEASRESDYWWKSFMGNAYENHSGAVTPKMKSLLEAVRTGSYEDFDC